jgi:hypothetical protein
MCLPYGALLAAGGILAVIFDGGLPALAVAAAGGLQLVLSKSSLSSWREGQRAPALTLLQAGAEAGAAHAEMVRGYKMQQRTPPHL